MFGVILLGRVGLGWKSGGHVFENPYECRDVLCEHQNASHSLQVIKMSEKIDNFRIVFEQLWVSN